MMRYHYTFIRMAKIKKTDHTKKKETGWQGGYGAKSGDKGTKELEGRQLETRAKGPWPVGVERPTGCGNVEGPKVSRRRCRPKIGFWVMYLSWNECQRPFSHVGKAQSSCIHYPAYPGVHHGRYPGSILPPCPLSPVHHLVWRILPPKYV